MGTLLRKKRFNVLNMNNVKVISIANANEYEYDIDR